MKKIQITENKRDTCFLKKKILLTLNMKKTQITKNKKQVLGIFNKINTQTQQYV